MATCGLARKACRGPGGCGSPRSSIQGSGPGLLERGTPVRPGAAVLGRRRAVGRRRRRTRCRGRRWPAVRRGRVHLTIVRATHRVRSRRALEVAAPFPCGYGRSRRSRARPGRMRSSRRRTRRRCRVRLEHSRGVLERPLPAAQAGEARRRGQGGVAAAVRPVQRRSGRASAGGDQRGGDRAARRSRRGGLPEEASRWLSGSRSPGCGGARRRAPVPAPGRACLRGRWPGRSAASRSVRLLRSLTGVPSPGSWCTACRPGSPGRGPSIPIRIPACCRRSVRATSSTLGVGSPDGWLWKSTMAAAVTPPLRQEICDARDRLGDLVWLAGGRPVELGRVVASGVGAVH